MTRIAAALEAVASYGSPVRFRIDERKRVIRALDVSTRRIVAEFAVGRDVDPSVALSKIVETLVGSGECEIQAVDGEDVDTPLTIPEGVEI